MYLKYLYICITEKRSTRLDGSKNLIGDKYPTNTNPLNKECSFIGGFRTLSIIRDGWSTDLPREGRKLNPLNKSVVGIMASGKAERKTLYANSTAQVEPRGLKIRHAERYEFKHYCRLENKCLSIVTDSFILTLIDYLRQGTHKALSNSLLGNSAVLSLIEIK